MSFLLTRKSRSCCFAPNRAFTGPAAGLVATHSPSDSKLSSKFFRPRRCVSGLGTRMSHLDNERKDDSAEYLGDAGTLVQYIYGVSVRVSCGKDLIPADVMGKSDPYCVVTIDGTSRKTKICKYTLSPEWNEDLTFLLPNQPKLLHLRCLDWDKVGKSDPLGDGYIALSTLPKNGIWDDWLELAGVKSGKIKIRVQITLIPKNIGQTVHDAFSGINPRDLISNMELTLIGARNLKSTDPFTKADPYAKVHFNAMTFRSHMVPNTNTPTWDFKCPIWVTKETNQHIIKLSIFDSDVVKDRHMGNAYLRPSSFELNKPYELWIPLTMDDPKTDAQLSELLQTFSFDVDHPETAETAAKKHEQHPSIHIRVLMKDKHQMEGEFVTRLIADYDADRNGTIELEELIHLAQTIGSKLSDEDLHKIFQTHDKSGKGQWGPQDILEFLQSPSPPEYDLLDKLLSVMIHGPESLNRLLNSTVDSVDNANTKVLVQDRESGMIVHENIPIYIKSAMRLLYRTVGGRAASRSILKTMKNLTMKAGSKMDNPRSKKDIPGFIQLHKLDINEIEKPVEEYKTFNEFFYRKLKPGVRVCAALDDSRVAVSPADCRMMVFETIQESQELWIKGKNFTLSNLFGKWDTDGSMAAYFNGGSLVIARLAPQDYHRFHYPVTGLTKQRFMISGEYNTVNPIAIRKPVDVYTDNKRCICPIQTKEFGLVVLIAVAATMVGSIEFDSFENKEVHKFDPAGYFAFGGSTTLVLFKPSSIRFDSDLLANSHRQLETLIKVGSSLGTATGAV